jgi:hypothetical protein
VCDLGINLLKQGITEGENPVFDLEFRHVRSVFRESSCLGLQL